MGGYIYLICDPANDTYKIGVTRNLESNRIKKLQTGNSTELHISYIYKCQYPFRLEKMLHNYYYSKRILNEWFEFDSTDCINFINTCKELDYRISIMKDNPFFAKDLK